MRTRLLLLAFALVILAACDTTAPPVEDALVGTWTLASTHSRSVLTLAEDQVVTDLAEPMQGSFQVTGQLSGVVRYLDAYAQESSYARLRLLSVDPASGAPDPGIALELERQNGHYTLFVGRADAPNDPALYAPPPATLRDGPSFTLDEPLYPTSGGEVVGHVAGTLTLGHRTVRAGEPTAVETRLPQVLDREQSRYRFEADGTLAVQEVRSTVTIERTGAWERTGDRLVLSLTDDDRTVFSTYRVELDGSELRLLVDDTDYPCDAMCLRASEGSLALVEGSLQARHPQTLFRYERTADALGS